MHFVDLPVAFVFSTVAPKIDSFAVDVIIVELTDKHAVVRPFKRACSVLLPVLESALVARAIRPTLYAIAVLLVLVPLTSVLGSVHVDVGSFAMRLVVKPLAFIDVTVCVD
jgi:hypothetical protein